MKFKQWCYKIKHRFSGFNIFCDNNKHSTNIFSTFQTQKKFLKTQLKWC